ncbi:MAG TPA: helix-turn-helix transcriptional regulator [Povalibacter sp.]|uniref:PadR family transcriptional regulator n=1 Tax=Povalibacter sp. TaxID=1962978 RepID=UPI002BF90B22|nr:helix-turn-helix transcriptional regulator [Povalibacter sp.]HMN45653.1 helix-turn-helix transcriptional regulator [Povalibacter sp.]
MKTAPTLGQFEQVVMTAVLRLKDDAYGVTIHEVVEKLSNPKAVALGAVYATLDRLEDKGLISSWLADPTPERGGRSKRHYRLERDGEIALRESVVTARRICDAVEHAWGAGIWSGKWKPVRQK